VTRAVIDSLECIRRGAILTSRVLAFQCSQYTNTQRAEPLSNQTLWTMFASFQNLPEAHRVEENRKHGDK